MNWLKRFGRWLCNAELNEKELILLRDAARRHALDLEIQLGKVLISGGLKTLQVCTYSSLIDLYATSDRICALRFPIAAVTPTKFDLLVDYETGIMVVANLAAEGYRMPELEKLLRAEGKRLDKDKLNTGTTHGLPCASIER